MAYNSLVNLPSEEDIIKCHKIFCNTFVFVFMNKLRKYGNLLQDCAYIEALKKDSAGDLNKQDDMESLLRSCVREYNDCELDSHVAADNIHIIHGSEGISSEIHSNQETLTNVSCFDLSGQQTPVTKQDDTNVKEKTSNNEHCVNGLDGQLKNYDNDVPSEEDNKMKVNKGLPPTSPKGQIKRNSSIRRIKGMVKKYTVSKVFQWVYKLVKLKRAKKIIPKLQGMSELEVKAVIEITALEVFVAYQYQIGMLDGDNEIIILAKHAVLCCMTYLSYFDAEFNFGKLSEAVIDIFPKHSNNCSKFVKTKFTSSEYNYRWKVDCIFKCPGLRIKSAQLSKEEKPDNSKTNHSQWDESQNSQPRGCIDNSKSDEIIKSTKESSFEENETTDTYWSTSRGMSAIEWMKCNSEKSKDSPYSKMEESFDSFDLECAGDEGDGVLVPDLCCVSNANEKEEDKEGISEDGQQLSQLYAFFGCFTPYGHVCNYNIYGFRGPLHIWRNNESSYSLIDRDRVTCQSHRSKQAKLEDANLHQLYIPYFSCNHKMEPVDGDEAS